MSVQTYFIDIEGKGGAASSSFRSLPHTHIPYASEHHWRQPTGQGGGKQGEGYGKDAFLVVCRVSVCVCVCVYVGGYFY